MSTHGNRVCYFEEQSTYPNNLRYVNATWLTAHNAFATKVEGWTYKQQNLNMEQMFDMGVRSFMLDIHPDNGNLYLAHINIPVTKYLMKDTNLHPLESYFTRISGLLEENPDAIITLHFEDHSASSDKVVELVKATGLHKYTYSESPNDVYLTLGEMRQQNARLVLFSDYQKERDAEHFKPQIGLNPTTEYKENFYQLGKNPGCNERAKDFRADYEDPKVSLFVLNHFYWSSLELLGSYDSINLNSFIKDRMSLCKENFGLYPNFIAVDFVEKGDLRIDLIYELNSEMASFYPEDTTVAGKCDTEANQENY